MTAQRTKGYSLVWLLPTLGGGGAERTVVNLTSALQARGVDCAIGLGRPTVDYLPHVPVEPLVRSAKVRLELWPLLGRAQVGRFEATRQADATISFTTFANLLNCRMSDSVYPRYISIRTTLSRALFGPSGPVYRRFMQRLYPRATKVVAISKFVAEDLVSYLGLDPASVQTIYNPVPTDHVERLAAEPLPEPWASDLGERFTILATGRLSSEKGHAHLIRVVARIRARGSDCRLLIAGKGPRLSDYAQLGSELGLRVARASDPAHVQRAADLVFLGFLDNPFSLMRRAHAFALPSALEGLGQSLLEAVAAGATIVASDCDAGPREILATNDDYKRRTRVVEEAECGWLVPPPPVNWRSPCPSAIEQWVQALEYLLEHAPDKRDACRERAAAFDTEPITDEWLGMLGW